MADDKCLARARNPAIFGSCFLPLGHDGPHRASVTAFGKGEATFNDQEAK